MVSERPRGEFEPGRTYYPMHDTRLVVLPNHPEVQPDTDMLQWHNKTVFRG
jgi:hypothetical protein